MNQAALSRRAVLTALLFVAWVCGCDRTPPEPVAKPAATPEQAPDLAPEDKDDSYRYAATGRIVAIGDLHGDLGATRRALRTAGVIDDRDHWIGGSTVLVQTGDVLDRGDDERAILDLMGRLTEEASKAGGAVHALLGNHEIMNVQGDLRYVTRGGFTSFEPMAAGSTTDVTKFPEHARARAAAFLPGGAYAVRLAKLDTIAMVGDTLFVHGGVLPSHLRYGIGRINREVKAWMRGDSPQLPSIMLSDTAPTWSRRFSEPDVDARDCRVLASVLDKVKATRMVVGHTPQKSGITSACEERVWRIDIGLAAHYGGPPAQVLAIEGGKARVVREDPKPSTTAP